MTRKTRDRDGIYERPDRPGYWGSWIDATGRRRRKRFEAHTLTQARALLAAERQNAEKNRTLGYIQPSKDKFADMMPRYLKHQKSRITTRSFEREEGIVTGHLVPYFGDMKLADIRRTDLQQYITERALKVSSASVVKEMNVMKHILALAVEWELVSINYVQHLKAPKPAAGRVRYLQPTELRAVMQACPEWLRPIASLAVSTGMRRGEILGLRWLDIDRVGSRVLLPQTKNGEGRIVYLNKLAQQALDSVPRAGGRPTDRVFGGTQMIGDYVSQTFAKACRHVDIIDFSFHDLRHTAASWMRMGGADIHTVAQVLGHKDLRMAARYQHLSPAFISEAVGLLDSAFAEAITPPERPTSSPQRHRYLAETARMI